MISKHFQELNLIDFSKRHIASPTTTQYSIERRGIMGDAPQTTKLIQSKIDEAHDYITFFFLTEATEKYGPDHQYLDTVPELDFQFERDPSKTYEIQLRFFHLSTLLKLEPPKAITPPQVEPAEQPIVKPQAPPKPQPVVQVPEEPEEGPEPQPVAPEARPRGPEQPNKANAKATKITPNQAQPEEEPQPSTPEELIRYFHSQKEGQIGIGLDPDTAARDYWDEHLENNMIRRKKETSAGAFLAWMIEAAGDIIREMGKTYQDPNYIGEKVDRLKNYATHERDWRIPLSQEEEQYRILISKQIDAIPVATDVTATVKKLLQAIIGRRPDIVEFRVGKVESMLLKPIEESVDMYPDEGAEENNVTTSKVSPGQATGGGGDPIWEAHPKKPFTLAQVKNWLWSTDFAVWSNAPSFHWQGFNYNMSVLGASIFPTNIEPHVWNKTHGDALIDKHLFDLFIHIRFFINQMASSLINKIRQTPPKKEAVQKQKQPFQTGEWVKIWEEDIGWLNGVITALSFTSSQGAQAYVDWDDGQKTWEKISDLSPSDGPPEDEEFEPEASVKNPFEGDEMFQEDTLHEQEFFVKHSGEGNVEITFRGKDRTWPVVEFNPKEIDERPADELADYISYRTNWSPEVKNKLKAAMQKAALVTKDLRTNKKFRGMNITISIGRDGKITGRKQEAIQEAMGKPSPVEWASNEAWGTMFDWQVDGDRFQGRISPDSTMLKDTLMEYDSKEDKFVYEWEHPLDWKKRKFIYDSLDGVEGVDFVFSNETVAKKAPPQAIGAGVALTGHGHVGDIFATVIKSLEEFIQKHIKDFDFITFEAKHDSHSRAALYLRLAKAVLNAGIFDFKLLIFVNKKSLMTRFFVVKTPIFDNLFRKTMKEAQQFESLVMTYGPFSPPTEEHIKLLKKVVASAKQVNGSNIVFISPDKQFAHDEISLRQKAQVLKEAVPELNICYDEGLFDIYDAFVWAYTRHYKDIYVIVGSDEVSDVNQILEASNGNETEDGYFEFKRYKVISYGKGNPDKSQQTAEARNAIINNDFDTFLRNVQGPDLPKYSHAKKLFQIMQYEYKNTIGMSGI